jgi:hypothetical protein
VGLFVEIFSQHFQSFKQNRCSHPSCGRCPLTLSDVLPCLQLLLQVSSVSVNATCVRNRLVNTIKSANAECWCVCVCVCERRMPRFWVFVDLLGERACNVT